ncbi:MAG: SLBB domain-containing protein, partial [Candidatus Omnitrophica bacterium]|nr:SLBB domain-containing protein [Candidatus Omnitrophota bacterium]
LILISVFCFFVVPLYSQGEKDYILSKGDLIEVDVYGEPDLHTSARVSEDGTINFPLIGNVRAEGLTVRELERLLTQLLAQDYLVNPQVSIFVREYARIFVLGQVRSPGAYELKGKLTLTSAIALAGGFLPEGDPSRVKLIRTVGGSRQVQEFDIDKITNNLISDIELKPNDTIMVEEYGRISIVGQIQRPGTYSFRKGLTVLEAIGMAGGFTPIASIDGTSVIRLEEGKKKIIRVKISDITKKGDKTKDILLQPGDTIVVPESLF